MLYPSWPYLNLWHPGKRWSEAPSAWGPCSGRIWMKWDRSEWCPWTNHAPEGRGVKIPDFTLETPMQPFIWQIAGERHLGIFFHASILYSALCNLPSPDVALPKCSDGGETTKNTDKNTPIPTCKSTPSWPLGLAGCAVSLKQAIWL